MDVCRHCDRARGQAPEGSACGVAGTHAWVAEPPSRGEEQIIVLLEAIAGHVEAIAANTRRMYDSVEALRDKLKAGR